MRTFRLAVGIDCRVVVTDDFVKSLREDAKAAASTFLVQAHTQFPEDDEQFVLHVLKNGTRKGVRQALIDLYASSGLGCTLSPATVQDCTPVLATQID